MIKIEVRSHGLVVRCETDYERQTVLKVVQANQDQMDVMARIRNPKAPPVLKDRYALVGRYFFVMNRQLQQPLINRIEYTRQQYELTECPPTETPDIDFQWEKKFELREDQLPVADFLKDAKDTHSLMIESPPGSGKTVMSINHCINLNKRTMFIMRPGYMEQWLEVLLDSKKEGFIVTNLEEKDVFLLKSKNDFDKLDNMLFKGKLDFKVIIASNKVYDRYVKSYVDYEESLSSDTPLKWKETITPLNICEELAIGTVVADEVHSDLRFWHTFATTLNVPLLLGLSGTMISRDPFILKMQNQLFPEKARYNTLKRNPYINYLTANYALEFRGMKTENNGIRAYNQTAYEKSIAGNSFAFKTYCELIRKAVENAYLLQAAKDKTKVYRCLIYVGKVDVGKAIVKYLKKHVPDIPISNYNAGDPYSTLIEYQIIVSTPGKASTAVDIKNLLVVVDTTSSNSIQSIIQRAGRLRFIKTDLPLTYVQFVNVCIEKHKKYHIQRQKDLKPFIRASFVVHL